MARKMDGWDDMALSLVNAIETSLACDECGENYANLICGQCGDQLCADCIDGHYDAKHTDIVQEAGDGA